MKNTVLTHRGYVIDKSELKKDKLSYIKQKLTVKPFLGDFEDDNNETEEFEVFTETDKTITVPRYWGIKKFKEPSKIES